jgi:PBP1b-binding outer membrane lipoprotein LpoB
MKKMKSNILMIIIISVFLNSCYSMELNATPEQYDDCIEQYKNM